MSETMIHYIIYLHLDLVTEIKYISQQSGILCIISGGLVDSFNWSKNGKLIEQSNMLFNQSLTITNRYNVSSILILSSENISYLIGLFQCTIRDGNSRTSKAMICLNGTCSDSIEITVNRSLCNIVATFYNSIGYAYYCLYN